MEDETKYYVLIFFVVFLFIKKIIDLIIEAKFPTYKDVKKSSSFWQNLVKLDSFLQIVSAIFVIYFLMFFNLNYFIKIIFIIILLQSINYFLVEYRYIFLFIDDNNNNQKIIDLVDIYTDGSSNLIISVFALFALVKIFV
jgi:hypothetical protein